MTTVPTDLLFTDPASSPKLRMPVTRRARLVWPGVRPNDTSLLSAPVYEAGEHV